MFILEKYNDITENCSEDIQCEIADMQQDDKDSSVYSERTKNTTDDC